MNGSDFANVLALLDYADGLIQRGLDAKNAAAKALAEGRDATDEEIDAARQRSEDADAELGRKIDAKRPPTER